MNKKFKSVLFAILATVSLGTTQIAKPMEFTKEVAISTIYTTIVVGGVLVARALSSTVITPTTRKISQNQMTALVGINFFIGKILIEPAIKNYFG